MSDDAKSQSPKETIPITDKVALLEDILVCVQHRRQKCSDCDVDFVDQNLMTKNLAVNKGRLPPPHPQMGQAIQQLKTEGNTSFRNKDFAVALKKYNDAIKISGQRPVWDPAALVAEETSVLLCNQAACLLELERYQEALYSAEVVTRVKHNWAKGHFRKGRAMMGMHNYPGALHSFMLGCALDSSASDMKTYFEKTKQYV
ncbi:hypothetical protein IWQ62_005590 [Dispira parvispora]|uniref:Translocation protein sec72 n=1 Tax=Dispira parvispora TaxID=1520584 RepID=A0A9W8AQN3_9FUNG|nr:hypothetical protein IWQ62_005590 [Dispira parvispora]